MRKNTVALALEAVAYQQSTEFFDELTKVMQTLLDAGKSRQVSVEDMLPIEEIVKRHTNITVSMLSSDPKSYDAYTGTPDIDANSPIALGIYRWNRTSSDSLQKINKARGAIGGFVDRETGRVGGCFTEFVVPLCIGRGWFNARQVAQAEELTAILLHEVGHIFTEFEMVYEAVTCNCIMQGLAQDWLDSDRVKRVKLLDAAVEAAGLVVPPDTRDALVSMDDADKVVTVMLSADVFPPRSVFATKDLDTTASEAMADQFSVRMGAGAWMGKANLLFFKYCPSSELRTKTYAALINFTQLLKASVGGAGLAASFAAGGLMPLLGFGVAAGAIWSCLSTAIASSGEEFNGTYDTPRNRLRRCLVEARGYLKIADLQPDQVKKQLRMIREMEEFIETLSSSNRLFEGILNTVWRERGRLVGVRRRMEIVEGLGNNVLYQAAAELRNK